jgi:hypothetical protein
MSIFSQTLLLYKDLLKEGNILLFNVDITRDTDSLRIIVRKVEDFDTIFKSQKYKINLYLQDTKDFKLLSTFVSKSINNNNSLFVFINKDNKLVSLDFSRNYEVTDYMQLDKLNEAKKVNYSFEFQ